MIAVHCGAGTHHNHAKYNKLCKKACRKGIEFLKIGGSALEAVKIVISVLEDDPLTNCGYGSNLTFDGIVEGDASIMDGKTLLYGGCGAVPNVKNPICLAHSICMGQLESQPFGLVPPSLLVGKGARTYAKTNGLKMEKTKNMISKKALSQFRKYKNLVTTNPNEILDTVGALCVDCGGNIAAGCSSGGILLKKGGRIGQAAIYGSGVWADSFTENENSIAVCTSGCGEHLIRTQLAKTIADDVKFSTCPTVGVSDSITRNFLQSRFLNNVTKKLCGALILHIDKNTNDLSLLWAHTTDSMSIGFMRYDDANPQALVSELPPDVSAGIKVNVSGVYSYNKN